MSRCEEDALLRYLMKSTACHFTEEQLKEIEADAPWIRLTDDGVEMSRGMVELLRGIY